jgi:hypothetical protein
MKNECGLRRSHYAVKWPSTATAELRATLIGAALLTERTTRREWPKQVTRLLHRTSCAAFSLCFLGKTECVTSFFCQSTHRIVLHPPDERIPAPARLSN